MATTTRLMAVPSAFLWDLLSDGWLYASWVVGTVRIRSVDQLWPAEGSKIHHSFGAWPLMLDDETEVLECDNGRRLLLQARGWPVGEATIQLDLESTGEGATMVSMAESPTSGPGAWVNNAVLEAVARRRLDEVLGRLARLAEGRRAMSLR